MLCTICQDFEKPGTELRYDVSRWEQDPRARNACRVCDMLWRCLYALLGTRLLSFYRHLVIPAAEFTGPMRADLLPSEGNALQIRKIRLQFFVEMGKPFMLKRIGSAYRVSESGLSRSSLSHIRRWIDLCEQSHPQCRVLESTPLPTRVVRIGKTLSDCHLHVSKPGQRGRYLALSHCWGGSAPLTTTKAGLPLLTERILFDQLPQTFADAFQVALALGVEYLWIDSLCIIQDSPEDWAREAGHMAAVYENAYLVISADAAENCQAGFLSAPARKIGPSAAVPLNWNGVHWDICVREKGSLMRQLPVHGWHPQLRIVRAAITDNIMSTESAVLFDGSPKEDDGVMPKELKPISGISTTRLSTRGWVMQERLLSTRTLHFGPAELGWECRARIACECTATSIRTRRGAALMKGAVERGDWEKLVKEYTRTQLSVRTDRLPALGGLAMVFEREKGLQGGEGYIAGLWRGNLGGGLLWHLSDSAVVDHIVAPSLGRDYAPSWSWASRAAPVQYAAVSKGRISDSFRILDTNGGDATTPNPYGSRRGASITVTGICITVVMRSGNKAFLEPANFANGYLPTVKGILDQGGTMRYYEWKYRELVFLLIADGVSALAGLLLESTNKGEKDVFERVGFAFAAKDLPRRSHKYYSSDSSEVEDQTSDKPCWPQWAWFGKLRTLKIV